jgi:hypothetical protein
MKFLEAKNEAGLHGSDLDTSDTDETDSLFGFRFEFMISKPLLMTSSSLASTSRRKIN